MASLVERNQVGKRESLADLISVVESKKTPLTSMIPKRTRPTNNIHNYQLKKYRRAGHGGVLDNKDADNFTHTGRKKIEAVGQKVWDLPSVSDFADEAEVAGLGKGEMAAQIADSIVVVKNIIEARAGSDADCQVDDGSNPNETRGFFSWGSSSAQSKYPVPEDYRPSSGMSDTSALASLTEETFKELLEEAFIKWRGMIDLDGFVGIKLKSRMTKWTYYDNDPLSQDSTIRRFYQKQDETIKAQVNFLQLDTGKVRLHPTANLLLDSGTGEDTDYTHRSGLFMDMSKQWMRFTRKPKVKKLEDKGGGPRAIVDAIFMLGSDNPSGIVYTKTDSDS